MPKIKLDLRYVLMCLLISCLCVACCFTRKPEVVCIDTTNIYSLENARASNFGNSECSPPTSTNVCGTSALRIKFLRDTAMSIGAQGGLAWSSEQMNRRMQHDRKYLDTIFNFNAMVLSHGIMPPVLVEGDRSLNLADPSTIRVADKTYKIIQDARFATTPPNWREYLWMVFSKPECPHRALLPRNACEQKIWRAAVRAGWQKGIEQGYSIFHQNLARLKRDYYGMVLYRKLLQEKMINPPFVARTELGVTGDGVDMRINDQVLRIVEQPRLKTNSRGWRAIVVRD